MRTLEEAAAAGKWRYVLHALSKILLSEPSEENLRFFTEAVGTLRHSSGMGSGKSASGILLRYLRCRLRRNHRGCCQCAIDWLCLFPSSTLALRRLAASAKKFPAGEPLFLAATQLLPLEKIRRDDRTQLCRALLAAERGGEAAAVARRILELQPDSAEARHLLWSALLRSDGGRAAETGQSEQNLREKLFTVDCE